MPNTFRVLSTRELNFSYSSILLLMSLLSLNLQSTKDVDKKEYYNPNEGLLIYDDALIIEGISRKWYSIKPRIEIKIKYMESFDSLFNLNKIESKLKKGTNNHG